MTEDSAAKPRLPKLTRHATSKPPTKKFAIILFNFFIFSPKKAKLKKETLEDYTKAFSTIRFDDFFQYNENKVEKLNFDTNIQLELENQLIYDLQLAKEKEDHFLKVSARVLEPKSEFVINQNDGEEELKKIQNIVEAQATAQRVNRLKSSWIYKINKDTYEKIVKDKKFFL